MDAPRGVSWGGKMQEFRDIQYISDFGGKMTKFHEIRGFPKLARGGYPVVQYGRGT